MHEGFIPAPGQEDEDETYPGYPSGLRDNNLSNDGSDISSYQDSEDERLMLEVEENNDRAEDEDYSVSEEEPEEDPYDLGVDEGFSDEEGRVPKRGKPKTRGTRGGRRGGGRGGTKGGLPRRGRKPGTRGRPKGKSGPRPVADPGPEFKELQRMANEAFMERDFESAKEYALEAVKLNPEIYSAHNTLSLCHAELGEEIESIQTLIVGAPTKRDKDLWWQIYYRVEKLNPDEYPDKMPEKKKNALLLALLREIINLDSESYQPRQLKLDLAERLGKIFVCMRQCNKMLKIRPHDRQILLRMAQLGTSSAKHTRLHLPNILKTFEESVEYYISHENPSESSLDWSLLNVYLELLEKAGQYDYGLTRLKTLSRWIQKRKSETYWDSFEDDREFDVEDEPRRVTVPQFSQKKRRRQYGSTLPIEIRVQLGLFRLRSSSPNFEEAMLHLNKFEPENDGTDSYMWMYPDLFCIVADTLHATGHDKDALRFYSPLHRHNMDLSLKSLIGMYMCHKNLGEMENAEKISEALKSWNSEVLADLAILAKFFEDLGMHEEASKRAELVFQERGSWRLRKIGFQRYDELRQHFFHQRKQARGKYGVRKGRVKRYMKNVRAATGNDMDSDEGDGTGERPSLGPLENRPEGGLFRTKGRFTPGKPQAFMPIEPTHLEGTDVPVAAIDHKLFRSKLANLATNYADDLKAARAQHREIVASFARLNEIRDAADEGQEGPCNEYVSIARELIEEFSTFDIFYSDRKQAFSGYFRRLGSGDLWKESALMILAVEANRIEDGGESRELKEKPDIVPEEFYGIHFDQWEEVFARYALLLARRGDRSRCFSVIDVALQSNIFHKSKAYECDFEICRLACGLAVDDSWQTSAAVRYLLKEFPYSTDNIRLYSAANRLCPTTDGYASGPSMKVFMRYIKTMDFALVTSKERKAFDFNQTDDRAKQQGIIDSVVKYVQGHDPALFALVGYVFMSGGTYTSALNYFFRAFALTPEDPVLSLCIGVAYYQHAMKRNSENRQYQIQQGIAFLTRYQDLRNKSKLALHQQETEFNLGRIYHGLGLISQAIPYYERCIALSERVRQEAGEKWGQDHGHAENFATEASFALQSIYVISGDFEAASRVTESGLILE